MTFPRRLGVRTLTGLACVLAGPILAATDPLEDVEKTSQAWVQTRLETSRLESSWKTDQTLLESTLAALQERATAEEEKTELARAKSAKEREELATLRAKARSGREELQQMEARLKTLDTRLVGLRSTLPPRLSEGLDLAFRSLNKPDLSPAERMHFTLTILERCVQFNRAITCGEEALTLSDGGTKAVQVIYWGLSHAYALDTGTAKAWLGRPVNGHWSWEALPESAERIARLMAIYADKADPAFVAVPAKLRLGVAEGGK